MQALMLAAGMGKRLGKYTNNNTKCMVEVAGKRLIDRAIESVQQAGINKMIIVVGYEGQNLINYINDKYSNSSIEFCFINNEDYYKTNNIYSFYMAKEYLQEDDTILLESDLIFDASVINLIVKDEHPNIAVIAKYKSWMDGTVVTCDDENSGKGGYITQFIDKADMDYLNLDKYYKTVNIYKLSKEFCTNAYIPFLEAYMKAYGLNSYYETTLKVIAHLSKTGMYGYEIGNLPWYEIDDAQDLDIANTMFSTGKQKYDLFVSKFGGYWRYDKVLDFYYLVNPYFPTQSMVKKLQQEFPILLNNYPSGLHIQNMNAERVFGVDERNILVGNGAAELINSLGHISRGKICVGVPTFNEYVRCFRNCEIIPIDNSKWDYSINLDEYKRACDNSNMLMIVSPDNPSGSMLSKTQVEELLSYAKNKNVKVVIDESFIDFADEDKRYTLLSNEMLEKYPNLIAIKSIGKSYGVAGLRLGVLASSDKELLKEIKQDMQIWNINSFAEYYLQVYNLYAKDYARACNRIAEERNRMLSELAKIKGLKAYPSQANFIMIKFDNISSYDFCVKALNEKNVLIKDLSTKNYFNGQSYIRISVKDTDENNIILGLFRNLFI